MLVLAVLISSTLCSIRVINPFSEASVETTLTLPNTQYYAINDKFSHMKMAFVAEENIVIPLPPELKHYPVNIIKETHPSAFNTKNSCIVTKTPLRFKSSTQSLMPSQTIFIEGLVITLNSGQITVFLIENSLVEADLTQFSEEFQTNAFKTRKIIEVKQESNKSALVALLTDNSIEIFKVLSTTGKTKTAVIPHASIKGDFSDKTQILVYSNNSIIIDGNVIMCFEDNGLIHTELTEQPFIDADVLGSSIYLVQSDKQLVKYSIISKQLTRTSLTDVTSVKTLISSEPIILIVLSGRTEIFLELVSHSENIFLNKVLATETEATIENSFCTSTLCYLSTSKGILLFPHSKPPNEHFNPIILPFTSHSSLFYYKNILYLRNENNITSVSNIEYPSYHLNCSFKETGDKTIKLKSALTQCDKAVCSTELTIFLSITSKSAYFFLYFLSLIMVFLVVGLILCGKQYFSNYDQIPQE